MKKQEVKGRKKHVDRLASARGGNKPKVTPGTIDFDKRLVEIAFKSYEESWQALAKRLGVAESTINDFRKRYADKITALQNEKLASAKTDVEKALVKSATGYDHAIGDKTIHIPPNPKSLQFYFERFRVATGVIDDGSFDVFAGGWEPNMRQVGPLMHWDHAWGDNGNDQIVGLIGGRGVGKTAVMVRRALRLARINRGCEGMVLAPTYKMLSNPVKVLWEAALAACRIPYTQNKEQSYYTLWGDTRVYFRSFDNVDTSGRGPTLAWLLLDEFREGTVYDFATLMASVREPKARLRQIQLYTTPNGYDAAYTLLADPGSETVKSGRAVLYTGTTLDNYVLPKSFISGLMEVYDERTIQQEIYGQFIDVAHGRIYYNFSRDTHVGEYPIDWSLPVHIGQDFNYNPLCSVVCQVRKGPDNIEEVWVVDEVRIEGSDTGGACRELKARGYDPEKLKDNLTVYPDATAVQKSAATGNRSNAVIFREHGFENIRHPRANPRILDRYAAVNGMLRNANGRIRLRVDKRCRYLIADMEREVYKAGSQQREDSKDGAKERGHLADALGYFIHNQFAIDSAYNYEYRSY